MTSSASTSTKQALPTLTGSRLKTRKRDEKEKYDPKSFRDEILIGLQETGKNLEDKLKFLDTRGNQLDYRQYADTLFDVLIAGGMLLPGGGIKEETGLYRAEVCVFTCEASISEMKKHVQIIRNLTRRFKYLTKTFEESMVKILKFLKGFKSEERTRLAVFSGLILAEGLVAGTILSSVLNEHLVKEGVALAFVTKCFESWLAEKDITSVGQVLRKAKMDFKLLEFMPPQQQNNEAFNDHFKKEGLEVLVHYQKLQDLKKHKNRLRRQVDDKIKDVDGSISDLVELCQDYKSSSPLSDSDVVLVLWRSVMEAMDWNKKEELVADQARRHLKYYSELFVPFCEQGTAQLSLIIRIQEYCYENVNFTKIFHKIIILLYRNDVVTEQAILKWYNDAHLPKGKSTFLEQMKEMVDWLKTAEEESDTEDIPDTTV